MVSKNINKSKKRLNAGKYIFLILLFSYIFGICIGSFFVLSDRNNALFTKQIIYYGSIKILIFFILAFVLKYSGVLNGFILVLPMIMGIQNSALYSFCIMTDNTLKYETVLILLRDTATTMLLILYIVIVINQIINKRYNLKKDFKLFIKYFIGALTITLLSFVFKRAF